MREYKAWPFREAGLVAARQPPSGGRPVLFQTGFGPSGFPHVGHFSEVARTTWVRNAYEHRYRGPTRLICFSDDMDGLRKVPANLPQPDMLAANLGRPLHAIPDPFGCCSSFSAHMNMKLREFLDSYGFDYEFRSSRDAYTRGDFDEGLSVLLAKVDEVRELILPTLREENREHWSPFFPVCPGCGSINATRVTSYRPDRDSVGFACDIRTDRYVGCGESGEQSILGGLAKVGWKVDWALRWYAYEVDYEMSGKDLVDSVRLSGRIVRIMGKQPPAGMTIEMFLDEDGRRISSSAGRMGVTVDEWTQYAPLESLLYFLFQNPQRAKRLHWGIVPKCVDDFLAALRSYPEIPGEERPESELWHIHGKGEGVPRYGSGVDSTTVNNLISALGIDSTGLLKEFLRRYDPTVADNEAVVEALIDKGMNYYKDRVLPAKKYRAPSPEERGLLAEMRAQLFRCENGDEETWQAIPFEVARAAGKEPKELFRAFYEVLLGQERGPRFGSFVSLVGKERVLEMLAEKTA